MKNSQIKSGLILSYLSQIITILSGILYTPIMLRLLGQSEYGLYQLVNSVVSNLALLNFGFGSSYIKFYSQYKAKKDEKKIAKFNGMFLTIFLTMSCIVIFLGIILFFNIDKIFDTNLTLEEIKKAKVLMIIMIVNMTIMFPSTVFDCQTTAHEKFAFQKGMTIIVSLLNPIIVLPLLFLGYGSISMVSVFALLNLLKLICNIFYCIKILKVKFIFGKFDFNVFKELFRFTFFIFLNIVVNSIFWSSDRMLLGAMIGTTSVAIYSVAAQIQAMYQQITTTIGSVFIPRVNKIVAQLNDDRMITDLFTRVGRIQFLLVSLILTGFIFFGEAFINIWAGEGYKGAYKIALIIMTASAVDYIQTLGIEIQRAKNKHQLLSIVYFFIAIANIFTSMICIKIWGISGAAIGSGLTLIIGKGLITNIYYHKVLKIDIIYFWKQIIMFIPGLIIPCICGSLVRRFTYSDKIWSLGIWILVYVLIFIVSMWNISMNKSEKDIVYSMLNSKKSKKRTPPLRI